METNGLPTAKPSAIAATPVVHPEDFRLEKNRVLALERLEVHSKGKFKEPRLLSSHIEKH